MRLYKHEFGGLFIIGSDNIVMSYNWRDGWKLSLWSHNSKMLRSGLTLIGNNFKLK